MRASENLAVRNLRSDDIDFALSLTTAEGWSYTRGELERMLKLDPNGSFLYEEDRPLGFITCVTYSKTGVVGHLVVSKEVRGRKIGNSLITRAIEYMAGRGVDSILLYATQDGAKLYVKHGFKIVRDVSCIHFTNDASPSHSLRRTCPRVDKRDLAQICAIDALMFGDDRHKLIELLFDEFPGHAFKIEDAGEISGFCFGRVTDTGFDLGPWACATGSKSDADSLLRAALCSFGRGTVYIGIFPENKSAVELVDAFPRIRYWRTELMIRGTPRYGSYSNQMFGVAAFELG